MEEELETFTFRKPYILKEPKVFQIKLLFYLFLLLTFCWMLLDGLILELPSKPGPTEREAFWANRSLSLLLYHQPVIHWHASVIFGGFTLTYVMSIYGLVHFLDFWLWIGSLTKSIVTKLIIPIVVCYYSELCNAITFYSRVQSLLTKGK